MKHLNVVSLNIRQAKLCEGILKEDGPVPLKAAAQKARITACAKTLHTDLERIRDFAAGYQVRFRLNRGVVSVEAREEDRRCLSAAVPALYRTFGVAYTQERMLYIALDCLLEEKIPTLDMWSERFNISRPCILSDVKRVKEWLTRSGVLLTAKPRKGYTLSCTEADFRKTLVRWAEEFFGGEIPNMILREERASHNSEVWERLFGGVDLRAVCALLSAALGQMGLELDEPRFSQAVLYLALAVKRAGDGNVVGAGEVLPVLCPALEALERGLEDQLGLSLPDAELRAFRREYLEPEGGALDPCGRNSLLDAVDRIVPALTASAEKLLGLPFTGDPFFQENLGKQIFDVLRGPAPLAAGDGTLAKFRRRYPIEAALGQQFLLLVKQELGLDLPPESDVPIAMFIAAQLEKISFGLKQKKKVILVSASSLSASMLIYWQLKNELSAILDIVKICSYQEILSTPVPRSVDLIISTVNLDNLGCQNIVISPVVTDEDIALIRRRLTGSPREPAGPSALETVVFLDRTAKSSRQLLEQVGAAMVAGAFAYEGYTAALLRQEADYGSGLETSVPIALPHTTSHYTRREVLGVALTRYPIRFKLIGKAGHIDTRIVLFPILRPDNVKADFQFYTIIAKLRDKRTASALLACRSEESVRRFLEML